MQTVSLQPCVTGNLGSGQAATTGILQPLLPPGQPGHRGEAKGEKTCFVPDFSNHQESMPCSQPAGPEGRHGRCQKRALELQQAGDARRRSGRTSRACDTGTGMRQQASGCCSQSWLRVLSSLLFPPRGFLQSPREQRAAAPASHRSLSCVSPAIWIMCQLEFSPCQSFLWSLPPARQTLWSAVTFTLPPALLSAEAFLESFSFAQLPVLTKLAQT